MGSGELSAANSSLIVREANETHVSNWSGEDSIPKLQPKAGRSNNVMLVCASAPGATVSLQEKLQCGHAFAAARLPSHGHLRL